MWAVVTESGDVIRESRACLWPSLPESTRVRELRYRTTWGEIGKIEGYEAYGFQRYSLTLPDGAHAPVAGAQLIGVNGHEVTIIEIDEVSGRVTSTKIPRRELTYSPELLRHGVDRG
jgi:hypothetical protein